MRIPLLIRPLRRRQIPNAQSLLRAIRLNGADIMTHIMPLQNAVHSAADDRKKLFLKKRGPLDYQAILADGGVIFGLFMAEKLVACSCVNTALNNGRVEIDMPKNTDKGNALVFQGTMAHPDIEGKGLRSADILFVKRVEWAAQQGKTDIFASACKEIADLQTGKTRPGNNRVIDGLTRKGFKELEKSHWIEDRGHRVHIATLHFTLPSTPGALYIHLQQSVAKEIADKWVSSPLRPV